MIHIKGNTTREEVLLGILIAVILLLISSPSSWADQEESRIGIRIGVVNVEDEVGTAVSNRISLKFRFFDG